MTTLSEELKWRGFANQYTFADETGINEPRTFYLGVDPSAASMHIGNLAQVMLVKHLLAHGHKAIVLVGGMTRVPLVREMTTLLMIVTICATTPACIATK